MSESTFWRRAGFSRTDLLLVLAMLAVLVAVLVPAIDATQQTNAGQQTKDKLKQIVLAMHNFNDDYRRLPPACGLYQGKNYTVHQHLLPYLKQDVLHKGTGQDAIVPPFLSSLESSGTPTAAASPMNFAANIRIFGNTTATLATAVALNTDMDCVAGLPRTFVDGTANVIVWSTIYFQCGASQKTYARDAGGPGQGSPKSKRGAFFGAIQATHDGAHSSKANHIFQLAPTRDACRDDPSQYLQSYGTDGLYVGMGDASVRKVPPTVTSTVWNAATHPSDGLSLGIEYHD